MKSRLMEIKSDFSIGPVISIICQNIRSPLLLKRLLPFIPKFNPPFPINTPFQIPWRSAMIVDRRSLSVVEMRVRQVLIAEISYRLRDLVSQTYDYFVKIRGVEDDFVAVKSIVALRKVE